MRSLTLSGSGQVSLNTVLEYKWCNDCYRNMIEGRHFKESFEFNSEGVVEYSPRRDEAEA